MRIALVRGLCYFGFWLILFGFGLADLVMGVFATAIATWVSLRLLPSGECCLRPVAVEESKTTETILDVVEGMQFYRGFLSPYSSRVPRRWRP